MGLKDLIVPKWKHSKPEIRLEAVAALDDDSALLAEIAQADAAPEVRIAAIQKISDETALNAIVDSEQSESVRQTALNKRDAMYEKIIAASRDVRAVVAALEKYGKEKAIAAYLCEHQIDNESQIYLIKKIKNPQLLCKITEHECSLDAGTGIVGDIVEKEHLERIALRASNKKIRTLAQKKIETLYPDPLAEQRLISTKLEQCLGSMDNIKVELHTLERGVTLLELSRNVWNQLDPDRKHPLAEKFIAAENTLMAQIAQKEALHTIGLLVEQAELLDKEPLDSAQEKLENLHKQWSEINLGGLSIETELHRFTKASVVIKDKVTRSLEEKKAIHLKHQELEKCCLDLEKIIPSDSVSNPQRYSGILSHWNDINASIHAAAPLKQRFADLQKKYEEKIAAYAEQKQAAIAREKDYVLHLVEKMESAAKSKFHQAGSWYHDVVGLKRKWEKQYPLAQDVKNELEARFAHAHELFMDTYYEFKEQNSWQEWAHENIKAKIVTEIEQYEVRLQQGESLVNLARRVSAFENQWRRAHVPNSEKSHELDTRFHAVSNRIYSLGLAKKSELLETIKTTIGNDVNQDVAEVVKNIQKQWNDIGYLPPEIEKEIADTFYSHCNAFFEERKEQHQKYSQELQNNIAVREEICKEAEKFAHSTDWKETVVAFGELQKKWEEAWPAPMKRSRELWRIFNGYRETFFDKYDLYKQSNSAGKEELCEKIEQLLASVEPEEPSTPKPVEESIAVDEPAPSPVTDISYNRIFQQAIDLQRKWKESGPATKEMSEKLWNRFRTALDKVFAIVNTELSRNCALKEALVKEAEALALSDDWERTAGEIARIRDEWKKIKPAARRDEQALWTRLQSAGTTFFDRRREHFDERKSILKEQSVLKESLITDLELLVRIAGKGHLLKGAETASNAEILKKGISLRDEVVVDGDPIKTDENIDKKVTAIVKEWKKEPAIEGKEYFKLAKRYNEIIDILRYR
jgi:hypothetical protein